MKILFFISPHTNVLVQILRGDSSMYPILQRYFRLSLQLFSSVGRICYKFRPKCKYMKNKHAKENEPNNVIVILVIMW